MKASGLVLFLIAAMAAGAYAGEEPVPETPAAPPGYLEDCVAEEQGDCEAKCITEHNCCIKSCNWVKPDAKRACLKHCESILKKCVQQCEAKPAEDDQRG